MKNSIPVVALVGYTNAGKSTLLNALTGAGIPANDRLFDTLDTTTRKLRLSETTQVLLSDTVGFISKLPHHLVDAFQATLEELRYADLLVHVIDATDPQRQAHIAVVEKLIGALAGEGVPVISCHNKADLEIETLPHGELTIAVSAKTGAGLSDLLALMEQALQRGSIGRNSCCPTPWQASLSCCTARRRCSNANIRSAASLWRLCVMKFSTASCRRI